MTKIATERSKNNGTPNVTESVAGILERELNNVIHEWMTLVEKQEDLMSIALSYQDRTGHLPALLREVIVRLRLDAGTKAPISVAASHHGDLRRKQEAAVVAQQRVAAPASERKAGTVQTPGRPEAVPSQTKAPLDAPQRAKETGAAAQEQLQKSAKQLQNKTQAESQQRSNEAAAKVQEEARSKATESLRIARLEAQQRGQELEKKAQADAEKKAVAKPELRPKQEQVVGEPGAKNPVKKVPDKKAEGKPSSPEAPPVPPKSSP